MGKKRGLENDKTLDQNSPEVEVTGQIHILEYSHISEEKHIHVKNNDCAELKRKHNRKSSLI